MSKKLSIYLFLIICVLSGALLVNPARADSESAPADKIGYVAISFYPVSGKQVPTVVRSLSNDYAYEMEKDSEELKKIDAQILNGSPCEILFDGKSLAEIKYNIQGDGNQLGDTIFLIKAEAGDHSLEFKIYSAFDAIRCNFLGDKIEARPIVITNSKNIQELKVTEGRVSHLRVEDFAINIKKVSQIPGEDGYPVFGLVYWITFARDESDYGDIQELSEKLKKVWRGISPRIKPLN